MPTGQRPPGGWRQARGCRRGGSLRSAHTGCASAPPAQLHLRAAGAKPAQRQHLLLAPGRASEPRPQGGGWLLCPAVPVLLGAHPRSTPGEGSLLQRKDLAALSPLLSPRQGDKLLPRPGPCRDR